MTDEPRKKKLTEESDSNLIIVSLLRMITAFFSRNDQYSKGCLYYTKWSKNGTLYSREWTLNPFNILLFLYLKSTKSTKRRTFINTFSLVFTSSFFNHQCFQWGIIDQGHCYLTNTISHKTTDTCKEKKNLQVGLFACKEWEKEHWESLLHWPLRKNLQREASPVETPLPYTNMSGFPETSAEDWLLIYRTSKRKMISKSWHQI